MKAPKVYLRDTGLLHHLLNLPSADDVASHPVGEELEEDAVRAGVADEPAEVALAQDADLGAQSMGLTPIQPCRTA